MNKISRELIEEKLNSLKRRRASLEEDILYYLERIKGVNADIKTTQKEIEELEEDLK